MPQIQLPLVGRDNDVKVVAKALRPNQSAQTLLVTGPAGVGKTAVVESARQMAIREGVKVLRLGWESAEGDPGASALADAVCRVLSRIHDGRLPARITDIRRVQLRTAGRDGELTLLATLGRVLADAAHYVPFALIIDNAERMPAATASVLGVMLRAFRPTGVPVVMVRGSVTPSDPGAELAAGERLLELAPLGPADVQALVEQWFGRSTDPEVVEAVARSLGPLQGNPRAVLSLLGAMEEDDGSRELDGWVHMTGPEHTLRLGGSPTELFRLSWPGPRTAPVDEAVLEPVVELAHLIGATGLRLSDLHGIARRAPGRFAGVIRIVDRLMTNGVLVVDSAGTMSFAVPAFGTALRRLPIQSTLPDIPHLVAVLAAGRLSPTDAGDRQSRLVEHTAAVWAPSGGEVTLPLLLAAGGGRQNDALGAHRAARADVMALRHLPPRYPGQARVLRTAAELGMRYTDYAAILSLGEPLSAAIDAQRPSDRADLEIAARAWGLAALYEHQTVSGIAARAWGAVRRMPMGPELAALGGRYGIGPVVPPPDRGGSAGGDAASPGESPGNRRSDVVVPDAVVRSTEVPGAGISRAEVPGRSLSDTGAPAGGPCVTGVQAAAPVEEVPGTGLLPSPAQLRLLTAAVGGPAGLKADRGGLAARALDDATLDGLGSAAAYGDLAGAMACVLGGRHPMAGDSVAVRYSAMLRAYLSGDWAKALACARRLEVRGLVGEEPGASRMVKVLAAEIHLMSGDPGRAQAWMSTIPDGFTHPLAGQVRVGVRYLSGWSEEAYEGGWRDVRLARESGLLEGTDRLVLRLFQYGMYDDRPEIAQRAVAELDTLYEVSASPWTGRMLLLARSVLNRDLETVTEVFHAVRERGDRPLALLCQEWMAMLSDDPAPWLAAAIREAHSLGIRHIERTSFGRMARMYGLKLPLPRRRQAKEGFGELDVRLVGMLSEGATNRQIAVRLTCSEKTVEQHLTRLFRLTGCRSRSELAAARLDGTLARFGLPPDA